MEHHSQIWKDTAFLAMGQLLAATLVIGIFALLEQLDQTVVTGILAGIALATINHYLLCLFADKAAAQAANQAVKQGQKLLNLSYMGRMIGLLIALVLLAKSGRCDPISLVLPLALNRPILTAYGMLRQKGGATG